MTIPRLHDEGITVFQGSKVATIEDLSARLHCSIRTIRRRLKEWKTYTSYNQNGRYYTLPGIPEFDQYGLWKYRNIFFSKYGNLKKTINALIHQSTAGLSAFDLNELVGLPTHSLLSQLKNETHLYREKHQDIFVYFSDQREISEQQKCEREKINRLAAKHEPPSDKDAIVILAEFIKHNKDSVEKLTGRVRRQGIDISTRQVRKLFVDHGIGKKIRVGINQEFESSY